MLSSYDTTVRDNIRVYLFTAATDDVVGSWLGGAGGTTNLYDAINNIPPLGTDTETNLTQIEDTIGTKGSWGCGTVASKGISVGAIFVGGLAMCCHGEDVSTQTKTGALSAVNPETIVDTAFNFGDDVGALGVYPTNWRWLKAELDSASVWTPENSVKISVQKTDASSRVASVCFLGASLAFASVSLPPKQSFPRPALHM
jgi:hypothetical protein